MATVQRTYYRTDMTIGRLLLAIAFVIIIAAAFGWVKGSSDVNVFELGVGIAVLGLAIG